MYYYSSMTGGESDTPTAAVTGDLRALTAERPYDGIERRTIIGRNSTVAIYEFAPGAEFPLHFHEQEQTTLVQEGQAHFIAGDQDVLLGVGGWSVIAPGVPHRVVAGPEGTRFIAVVAPARAAGDYRLAADPAPGS